jgi:two-component sensor histidine kinase
MPLALVPQDTAGTAPLDAAAEANHRIANNLALIAALMRTQASRLAGHAQPLTGDEMRTMLEEFSVRVETVAWVHRLLSRPPDQGTVDLGTYLREIAEGIVAALSVDGENELLFAADPDCRVGSDAAMSLGLIVAELVTNAIKYAHPAGVAGKIEIDCRRLADGKLAIEVDDDGVGLPEDIIPTCSNGFGFRLVRSLAARAQARLAFHGTELGLRVTLELPLAPSAKS